MITDILWNVTQALHAKGIISFEIKDQILTAKGEGDNKKAIYLLHVLQRQLEAHSDPDQYLVNICNVLINQQQQTLTDIAISILQQLGQFVILLLIIINIFHISGQPIPDRPTHSSTPDRPTHSSTSTSHIERLNFFQRLFKKIRSRSTSNPSLCTVDPNDQSSSTRDQPTHSSTPDRATYSGTPDQATYSSTPDRPTHSGTPDRPTHSSTPDRPTYSSTPDRPTHSSTPDQATYSSTPDRPTHSGTPDRPTHSSTPDQATYSSTPDRPTHSSTPDQATYSSTPDRPTHSGTPDRPTHSSTPDRPTYSSTPDRPTHSSTPDRPTHSSTPDLHTHSSTSDRPTYSSTPDLHTHSSTSDRPTHSSTPDRLTHSSTPDRPTYSSTLDPSLQEYCQIIKDKFKIYKNESEWPVLRCGEQYFGRLSLVDRNAQNNKQWSITRGNNDIISQVHSKIEIEDVLKPNDSDQSLTVVVDGPPGIGKTTLCRKLLNLWANGELKHKQYDLVLYCPLRNINIAQANKLEQLLNYNYQCPDVSMVTEWLERSHGKGLLIIFDGWDELSTQLRQSSLPTKIICKQFLNKCSVVVTSRSYASSSLLKLTSVNKHVQIMGFLEEEINTVIKGTLENNPQIAQELIDELQIRNDVYTLCYIPLICSIVIHVFEVNGQLPKTLTKLYENFILQAIRRYVANTGHYDPEDIQSLNEKHLPSNIATSFKEICQFAYESLKENNPKMTFSSIEIQQHLKQTGYLGLIRNYDKDVYQFLHLSIQEFLAAWWIAKYNEKTEEILFNAHFDDDHFRMCLRFVAGLTQLKHEKNYQQYFNKELDLQCMRKPLFGFDVCYRSKFYQNPEIRLEGFPPDHVSTDDDDDNKFIACLQLLYESQNETLCEILSQSINNHSLCLDRVRLSVFDILCLSYFLNNSNITWNHLHLRVLNEQKVQILTNTLTNNSQHNQCKILQVDLHYVSMEQVFQLSFFHNIQQCYITLGGYQQDLLYKLLLSLLQLHQLKILHLYLLFADLSSSTTRQYSELTKCLEMNCTLQELVIERGPIDMANDIVNGVANNKSITSFKLNSTLDSSTLYSTKLSDETIQHLLKNNHTLQALDICNNKLSSSLNIVEVNTPLTAMGLNILHLPHIKGLQYLKLYQCHQPHLIFHSYPNLQQLDISLDTAESVNELFTILQSNTTLKALRVKIKNEDIYSSIGNSLRDMLTLNKTIQCLEIDPPYIDYIYIRYSSYIPSTYLSYLTTGLSYNNSLQELSVDIPLSHTNNQQLQTYFNVISQMYNLTELKVCFTLDQSYSNCSDKEMKQIMTSLYYEQGLPLVTNMLKLHTTIRLLHVQCYDIKYDLSQSQWIDSIKHLLQTIFLHPSLEYIRIKRTRLLQDTFKVQKKTLIDKRKQQQLIKPLPIVDIK